MTRRSPFLHPCGKRRYRVAVSLLIGSVLLLASRHYTAVRALDALRAERQSDRAYIHALEQTNERLSSENDFRRAELEILRREGDRVVLVGDGPLYNLMSRERAIEAGRIPPTEQPSPYSRYYQQLSGPHPLHKPRAAVR